MRACLHLYTTESTSSVFYQILNEDLNLLENDTFEYSNKYYNLLDDDAKKIFDRAGLRKGNYIVTATRTEPNDYWGEIRYLFIKPTA